MCGPDDFIIYQENALTHEQERQLIEFIDSQIWSTELTRRVQHYGYTYNYKNGAVSKTTPIPPEWITLFNITEDKCCIIVNEYLPGQGISPHIDSLKFREKIICYSLGSAINIQFALNYKYKNYYVQPRSYYIMHGDSRYKWTHEIQRLKYDNKIPRGRRISITIRWL